MNLHLDAWMASKISNSKMRSLALDNPGFEKYKDIPRHVADTVETVTKLSLHNNGPLLTILDIGTGFGYFPLACDLLGHAAFGLDAPVRDLERLGSIIPMTRVFHLVEEFKPLPRQHFEDGSLDLITVRHVNFGC